jgi:hypothetical protein
VGQGYQTIAQKKSCWEKRKLVEKKNLLIEKKKVEQMQTQILRFHKVVGQKKM